MSPLSHPDRRATVVYAKRPFAGPEAILAYLSRYTHRVAISNSRPLGFDGGKVTFRWKDYRASGKAPSRSWIKSMTLPAEEFIRRFLMHVLPNGFHRIRHHGLFASQKRAANIAHLRELIPQAEDSEKTQLDIDAASEEPQTTVPPETSAPAKACPCCAGRMRLIETFARGATPRSFKAECAGFDTS